MTVGKKMNRIGGQHVVEIDAGIRKLAKDRRGKAELRSEETAGALMGQDHSHAARYFIADSTEDARALPLPMHSTSGACSE
jgi:hypothetical protein